MANEISALPAKPRMKYSLHLEVGCECNPSVFDDARAMEQFNRGAALCESPIEFYLLAALQDQAYRHPEFEFVIELDWQTTFDRIGKREVICVPQACWIEKGYKFDFVIFDMRRSVEENVKALIVECDGHDYHERTEKQATYDRRRDRSAVFNGFSVFRFTGYEIHKDPHACANEIIGYVLKGIA